MAFAVSCTAGMVVWITAWMRGLPAAYMITEGVILLITDVVITHEIYRQQISKNK